MQLHDLMANLFELRQVAADQAKDGPSGSGAMARALTAYEWLGDNIEAFVAGLDPEMTEGPASQTEGGKTVHVFAEGCCSASSPCAHQKRDPSTICDVCTAANALALQETATEQETDLQSQKLRKYVIIRKPKASQTEGMGGDDGIAAELRALGATYVEDEDRWYSDTHRQQWLSETPEEYLGWLKGYSAALTPPETAEVVPVAGGDMNACPICKGHSKFDECSCHYAASKTVHLVPETTRLREDLGQVTRERDDAVKALETAREELAHSEILRKAAVSACERLRMAASPEGPIWGRWFKYDEAPAGSYSCLCKKGDGAMSIAWMPAQGRQRLVDTFIMPFDLPARSASSQGGE